ncbi:MAG: hypothetical protein IT463_10255, partial [Planctomycetes bacterium]|nr:hypothetical protein [Planctomycetota bacterium]
SVAGAPAWLTLNGSSLSGTPTVDDAGKTGTITVTADNGIAPRATQDFMLDVQAAPSITSIALVQIKAGVAYRYEVAMKGLPAPTLKATGLPKWLKLEGNVLAGTPHNADIGKSRRITLQASNGLKPDATQAFQIEVVANPEYLEMPWTLEELRAYWKPGLEWVVLGEMTVATGKAIRDRNPHKVLSVKGDLVEIEVINYFYKAGINGADVEEIKTTGTLDLGALAKGELFPGQSKVKYVGVENTDIAGKRLSCNVFEVEFIQEYTDKAGKQQQLTQVYRLHYIVGKPGLCAKQEQIQSGKPDNPHEATEIKEPKQPK